MLMTFVIGTVASGTQCFCNSQDDSVFYWATWVHPPEVGGFIKDEAEDRKNISTFMQRFLTKSGDECLTPHLTVQDRVSFVHFAWSFVLLCRYQAPCFLRPGGADKGHTPGPGRRVVTPASLLSGPLLISLDCQPPVQKQGTLDEVAFLESMGLKESVMLNSG